jgi:hypothetical protein
VFINSAFAAVLHLQGTALKVSKKRFLKKQLFIRAKRLTSVMLFSDFYPDYFTATIPEWKHLLKPHKYKHIVISSLEFLVKENRHLQEPKEYKYLLPLFILM